MENETNQTEFEQYYQECRAGEILNNRYGFIAVSRLRPSTQTIEHLWVREDWRGQGKEGQLIKHAYDNAIEHSCRYIEFEVNLKQPGVHVTHRRLVELGFIPVRTEGNVLKYERRVRD